jgi:adenylosuccinate synthase
MTNTVVVGTQWGDEGKGKIIDVLTEKFDIVVRYQGGNNAGHTVMVGDQQYILHLIPSGIVRNGKLNIIANGVVIDPLALEKEIDYLVKEKGLIINENTLNIAENAHVVTPGRRIEDVLKELERGKEKIGTTGKGIGPTYAKKAERKGIRIGKLLIREDLEDKLKKIVEEDNHNIKQRIEKIRKSYADQTNLTKEEEKLKNLTLKDMLTDKNYGLNLGEFYNEKTNSLDADKILTKYLELGRKFKQYIKDTVLVLNNKIEEGKSVLFEGAQGTWLDVDHGTYPYCTSSNPTVGGAITGTGVSPHQVHKVIGIVKAYTTRVGEGPFCGELCDKVRLEREVREFREKHGKYAELGLSDLEREIISLNQDKAIEKHTSYLGDRNEAVRKYDHIVGKALMVFGKEYGATTGRPRRCKWFEAPLVRRSVMVNGCTSVIITKLDVLDHFPKIKIIIGYRYIGETNDFIEHGKELSETPLDDYILANCEPIYKTMEGWMGHTSNAQLYSDLPPNAQAYLDEIAKLIGCEIEAISVGPHRRETLQKIGII